MFYLPILLGYEPLAPLPPSASAVPVWQDRTIASAKLRLLEYSAFMEVQRDPETVTLQSGNSYKREERMIDLALFYRMQ